MYGKQSPSNYRTHLSRSVQFNPSEWEVGLSEIIYSRTWHNVVDAVVTAHCPHEGEEGEPLKFVQESCTLPVMQYNSPEHFLTVWNECITKKCKSGIRISYDALSKHTVIKLAPGYMLELNSNLSIIAGFGEYKKTIIHAGDDLPYVENDPQVNVIKARYAKSPLPVNLNRLINTLYVYTDLVEPQLVGDAYVPLIRAVVDRSGEKGETVSTYYTNVHYVNVTRGAIHDVHVHITDDRGRDIPFDGGRVTVKLHFRKKR